MLNKSWTQNKFVVFIPLNPITGIEINLVYNRIKICNFSSENQPH